MGFQRALGTPFLKWFPVDSAAGTPDIIYVGQLVYLGSDGVIPMGAAAGAADTTTQGVVPLGIVVATNNRTDVYNTTYKTNQITGADTQALQALRDNVGQEGMFAKGDKQAMVQVDIIDACTWISGPIYKTSHGTVPTVVTATAASTDGLMTAGTTGACDFTPVADLASIYCRTGANANLYRTTIDSSTTAPQVDTAYPQDVAIGDTFVRVPLVLGQSFAQFDTESMFIDCAASPATDYYVLDVIELNLATAGKETALFRFNADHFCLIRA